MTCERESRDLWDLSAYGNSGRSEGKIQSLDDAGQPFTSELAEELAHRGLIVHRRDEAANLAICRAGSLIKCVASLERVVLECVRDVLILESPDEWHDVNHSEPRWPHLIFVSMPPATPVGDVRLAEAIVHEAMHLNLTFVENCSPLTTDDRPLYSPWRQGTRPATGVLHGLYVFASLLNFFEQLPQRIELSLEQKAHLERRRADILEECRHISRIELWQSLTSDGQGIVQRIFDVLDQRELAATL